MKPDAAIVLVGFMGAGKTTAALRLAGERGLVSTDLDRLIEERAATTIAELFASEGEPAFRMLEEEVACDLLGRARRGEVVSLSGGAVTSARVRAALAEHLVVWLDVDLDLAWRRDRVGAASASCRASCRRRVGLARWRGRVSVASLSGFTSVLSVSK